MSQELLTSQAYATAIIESSDDAILSKDLDGVIRSCNPATQRIFGYAPEELIGRPVRILIPDERQAEEDDILQRLRRGERVDHVRIDTAAHRSRAGFGIGLALVKAIVDLHGGTVEARSEGFGTGSEFVISLPLAGSPI